MSELLGKNFRIDGMVFSVDLLNLKGRELLAKLEFANKSLEELHNDLALMNKAKKSYISDLKSEIIQSKAGINLETFFVED